MPLLEARAAHGCLGDLLRIRKVFHGMGQSTFLNFQKQSTIELSLRNLYACPKASLDYGFQNRSCKPQHTRKECTWASVMPRGIPRKPLTGLKDHISALGVPPGAKVQPKPLKVHFSESQGSLYSVRIMYLSKSLGTRTILHLESQGRLRFPRDPLGSLLFTRDPSHSRVILATSLHFVSRKGPDRLQICQWYLCSAS